MGRIFELLDPPDGVMCWIGWEYRENKMGRAGGITYVYSDCKGDRQNCSGDYRRCHCRYSFCEGDPESMRLFVDSEWENTPFTEIRKAKGTDLSVLYPNLYKSVSSGEFMEILDSSFLVRGYYGPLWEMYKESKRKHRKCQADFGYEAGKR